MPTLDKDRCICCGLCARVCPMAVITFEEGAPVLHPERTCMECWHCAAICPRRAVVQEGVELYPSISGGELETLITMRRSVRHFQEEPPEKQVITRSLELAAWAPTGKNERTYGWTVVYGRERVLTLLNTVLTWAADTPQFQILTKLVRGRRDPVTCGAACVLFCHNTADAANPETDCVIAATTAELLLAKRGVGTCWGGYLRRAVDVCPAARELLGVPEGRHVYAALLTGVPDGEPYQNAPYRPKPDIQWR